MNTINKIKNFSLNLFKKTDSANSKGKQVADNQASSQATTAKNKTVEDNIMERYGTWHMFV